MIKDRNIFIEGIQGMGKSTLLQAIARKAPELHVCREGDYSPVELAWCTWMDADDYRAVLARYGSLRRDCWLRIEPCLASHRTLSGFI